MMALQDASSSWVHFSATISSPSKEIAKEISNSEPYDVKIHYVLAEPKGSSGQSAEKPKATILLIHGFPQTWYQFRHVIQPLADRGFRVIIPDYRGAGNSTAPPSNGGVTGGKGGGYSKLILADDLHTLVTTHLGITEKVHVVGHDIGGMVAHAYASWFPGDTASLAFGECPLPGSRLYEDLKHTQTLWHFTFHGVDGDLPERLVQGKERTYLRYFYDKFGANPWAIPPGSRDEDVYVEAYSRPGAIRAAFDTYRSFEQDARDNRGLVEGRGKSKVRTLALNGDQSFSAERGWEQAREFHEDVKESVLPKCGHWLAEEAPEAFVETVSLWVEDGKVR